MEEKFNLKLLAMAQVYKRTNSIPSMMILQHTTHTFTIHCLDCSVSDTVKTRGRTVGSTSVYCTHTEYKSLCNRYKPQRQQLFLSIGSVHTQIQTA